MRTLSILALIIATATPALAHRDPQDNATQLGIRTPAQVTKAAPISFDAFKFVPKAGPVVLRDRDR
jgi:hypothetical protein